MRQNQNNNSNMDANSVSSSSGTSSTSSSISSAASASAISGSTTTQPASTVPVDISRYAVGPSVVTNNVWSSQEQEQKSSQGLQTGNTITSSTMASTAPQNDSATTTTRGFDSQAAPLKTSSAHHLSQTTHPCQTTRNPYMRGEQRDSSAQQPFVRPHAGVETHVTPSQYSVTPSPHSLNSQGSGCSKQPSQELRTGALFTGSSSHATTPTSNASWSSPSSRQSLGSMQSPSFAGGHTFSFPASTGVSFKTTASPAQSGTSRFAQRSHGPQLGHGRLHSLRYEASPDSQSTSTPTKFPSITGNTRQQHFLGSRIPQPVAGCTEAHTFYTVQQPVHSQIGNKRPMGKSIPSFQSFSEIMDDSFPWYKDDPHLTDGNVLAIVETISEYMDEVIVTAPLSSWNIPWTKVSEILKERQGINVSPPQCQRVWTYLAYGHDIGQKNRLEKAFENDTNSEGLSRTIMDPTVLQYSLSEVLKEISPAYAAIAAEAVERVRQFMSSQSCTNADESKITLPDLSQVIHEISGKVPELPPTPGRFLPKDVQSRILQSLSPGDRNSFGKCCQALDDEVERQTTEVQQRCKQSAAEQGADRLYDFRVWETRAQEFSNIVVTALHSEIAEAGLFQ